MQKVVDPMIPNSWIDHLTFLFIFFFSPNSCSKYSLKEYKMCASASGQTTKWVWTQPQKLGRHNTTRLKNEHGTTWITRLSKPSDTNHRVCTPGEKGVLSYQSFGLLAGLTIRMARKLGDAKDHLAEATELPSTEINLPPRRLKTWMLG